ncbi:MAG: helix-turn-helix transcriptional regulator [Acidimicrobiales bacterium]|nr:helix-turn-helix transcriptional regulator [Acidimicrobiales bacterium]
MKSRLRAMRAEVGWSQAALADVLGVSRQTVNAIETGRYDPSLPVAFAIAAAFDTTIEDIFIPEPADRENPAR